MPNRNLGLPDSPRKLVYLKVVELLKTDPTLKRIITPDAWRTYADCLIDSAEPFGEDSLPGVEILPYALPASPETDMSVTSPLGIRLNLYTASFADCFDLWAVIEAVFLGVTGADSMYHQLRALYSFTTGVRLTQPAITPNPAGLLKGVWLASGTIAIDLRVAKR